MTSDSIFLHPDWMMTRYSGWRTVHRDANCLMLEKGRFPLRRVCILSALPYSDFLKRYDLSHFHDGATIFTLKIIPFEDVAAPFARIDRLTLTPDTRRMFHKFTFIIDLTTTSEELWLRMRPRERQKCRKAEKIGTRVRIETAPTVNDIDRFFALYVAMARLRGLAIPQRSMLESMFADRRLILGCAELNGVVLSMALVYLAGDMAMYLYGVSSANNIDGAGQLLHWELIRALKDRGISRYDLGGVPSVDESDGIYQFKKGFGGQSLALGPEFSRAPSWLQVMRRLRQWLRRRNPQV